MRTHKILFSGLAAMTATFLSVDLSPEPAPLPGPGGVIDSMRSFLRAVDQGDREALARHLSDRGRGQLYGFDEAGERIHHLEGAQQSFYDVSAFGEPLEATSREQILDELVVKVRGGEVKTVLTSIRAECPSGECSFAVLEFDRIYKKGDKKTVVPMRATALVTHGGGEAPHFKLFHWHASRVQPQRASSPR